MIPGEGPVAWVSWVQDKYPILALAIQSDNHQASISWRHRLAPEEPYPNSED